MSPGSRPAFAAGPPGVTSESMTPASNVMPERFGHQRCDRLGADTDFAATHAPVLSNLGEDVAHDVAGRGKPDPFTPA